MECSSAPSGEFVSDRRRDTEIEILPRQWLDGISLVHDQVVAVHLENLDNRIADFRADRLAEEVGEFLADTDTCNESQHHNDSPSLMTFRML